MRRWHNCVINMDNHLANDLNHILDHTHDLWNELHGSRLFITGGTGFFGKWLLESLLWANDKLDLDCRVTILTRSPDAFQSNAPHLSGHEAVSVLKGDIRTFGFPPGTFTHIIHAATDASAKLNDENPLLMLDTIIEGTRHTLDFAKSCGAKKFLLTSSGAVYGKQPTDMTHIPEDYNGAPDPLDPKSAYGQGKRLAEHTCSLYADPNLEIKIARCFAFVGPYLPLDIHFAIGNFIRDAMNGGPIIVQGDGTPYRSYLYTADLVVWLWTILLRGESLKPYNVGSRTSISIAELATIVADEFQNGIHVEIQGIPAPQKPASRYVPDTQRAEKELRLQETFSLQDGINRTKDWYKLK
jgi:nucleoside-diphosphate-sugar epimerase